MTTRLTAFSHGAGCACKLGSADLSQVLRHVPAASDPRVLVDARTRDDAAVFQLAPDRAAVATVDFFTPIVDDAYDFGRIAAANALSDVYAMGATPLFALNLVAWPRERLPFELLGDVLRGGQDVARAAGVFVVGGHSVDDPEPKYGMAAFGEAHPARIVTNAGARPGDALVLTKPLGTGVLTTALKRDLLRDADLAPAVAVMTTLNAGAARAMLEVGVHAATDVTGFGLLGHLRNVLEASGVAAELRADAVPLLEGARAAAERGAVPGGSRRNRESVASRVTFADTVDETTRVLLTDAQTSGGLLIAVPEARVAALVAALERERTPAAAVIGRVTAGPAGAMTVR
jgi:selenide,water dikinase